MAVHAHRNLPSGRDAGSWLPVSLPKICLVAVLVAVVSMSCALQAYVPGMDPTETETLEPTSTVQPTAAPQWSICTGVDGGTVNLRACAGTSCAVVGILGEGDLVAVSGLDDLVAGSSQWVMLTAPAQGWVNANYVCKEEK